MIWARVADQLLPGGDGLGRPHVANPYISRAARAARVVGGGAAGGRWRPKNQRGVVGGCDERHAGRPAHAGHQAGGVDERVDGDGAGDVLPSLAEDAERFLALRPAQDRAVGGQGHGLGHRRADVVEYRRRRVIDYLVSESGRSSTFLGRQNKFCAPGVADVDLLGLPNQPAEPSAVILGTCTARLGVSTRAWPDASTTDCADRCCKT